MRDMGPVVRLDEDDDRPFVISNRRDLLIMYEIDRQAREGKEDCQRFLHILFAVVTHDPPISLLQSSIWVM
jgi:hypothetical protein